VLLDKEANISIHLSYYDMELKKHTPQNLAPVQYGEYQTCQIQLEESMKWGT